VSDIFYVTRVQLLRLTVFNVYILPACLSVAYVEFCKIICQRY